MNFNPRPPRGGRQSAPGVSISKRNFNPRPPRGGRHFPRAIPTTSPQFQSTPPSRGATRALPPAEWSRHISIHAPLAGGDGSWAANICTTRRFQSTPPSRGATGEKEAKPRRYRFQSTPPSRGATQGARPPGGKGYISIHAPLAGGDNFVLLCQHPGQVISIHAPLAGGDALPGTRSCGGSNFNPRPPRGGRP